MRRGHQALAEGYAAMYAESSVDAETSRACPNRGDDSDGKDSGELCAYAAVEEVSAVPFMNNDVFVKLRDLELGLSRSTSGYRGDDVTCDTHGDQQDGGKNHAVGRNEVDGDPDRAGLLESLLTSISYRTLGEEYLADGRVNEAGNFFDDAYEEGVGCAVNRCSSRLSCVMLASRSG